MERLDNESDGLSPCVITDASLRPAGFEPATFGLGNRCFENSSLEKTNTYKTSKEQLTPKSSKQCKIDTQNLPPDLAEIVAVWPELPEHIKAAIKSLVTIHLQVASR